VVVGEEVEKVKEVEEVKDEEQEIVWVEVREFASC
jgi:hypothetical protein